MDRWTSFFRSLAFQIAPVILAYLAVSTNWVPLVGDQYAPLCAGLVLAIGSAIRQQYPGAFRK